MVERVRDAMPDLQRQIEPATAKEFAVAMKMLRDFCRVFGLPLQDLGAAVAIYRETLADLPADLLVLAVKRTIRNHKYHVVPKPSEIRDSVADDLAKRRINLVTAREVLR